MGRRLWGRTESDTTEVTQQQQHKQKCQFLVLIKQSKILEKCTMILFFCFSFDFSVSLPDVQRRTLDVAVKNSGGFLSKDKGLLGKVGLKSSACCKN